MVKGLIKPITTIEDQMALKTRALIAYFAFYFGLANLNFTHAQVAIKDSAKCGYCERIDETFAKYKIETSGKEKMNLAESALNQVAQYGSATNVSIDQRIKSAVDTVNNFAMDIKFPSSVPGQLISFYNKNKPAFEKYFLTMRQGRPYDPSRDLKEKVFKNIINLGESNADD